ncbi:MAG TPA: hypothetical protein VF718_07030 [Allosphingosinicella sp.]|jgi:hypothetical protein
MPNRTQLLGMILAALGVATALRGAFEAGSGPMTALGACAAAAGFALILRGHRRGR